MGVKELMYRLWKWNCGSEVLVKEGSGLLFVNYRLWIELLGGVFMC